MTESTQPTTGPTRRWPHRLVLPSEGFRPPTWAIALILATAALMAGAVWAIASPIGSSPDDDYHQSSIWCPPPLEKSGCRLVVDASGKTVGAYVPQSVARSVCYAMHAETSGSCLKGISDTELIPYEHIDQGAYPGGFYRFMHHFVGSNVSTSIVLMRLFNVLVAVALLGAGLAVLPRAARTSQSLAIISSVVPLGMFIIASVNPSTWAITGVATTWLGLHALLQAKERWRIAASATVALVGAFVAANARSDAGVYLVIVAGLTAFLHIRTLGVWWRRTLILAGAALLGCWSYFSASQAASLGKGWGSMPDRTPKLVLFKNVLELPNLLMGVFGQVWGLGWLDTAMPATVSSAALFVACGLLMVGFSQMTWLKAATAAALLTTIYGVALFGLMASNYYVGEGIQPRYLLPLIPVLLGMMLTGKDPAKGIRFTSTQLLVIGGALAMANGLALFTNLRRYVTGLDVTSPFLDNGIEWWWSSGPTPTQACLVGACAFALVALGPWATSELVPQGPTSPAQPERAVAGSPELT